MEQATLDKIEELRFLMVEAAIERGSLTDEKVVTISQQLDGYMVDYHNLMKRKEKKKNQAIYRWQIKSMKLYKGIAAKQLSNQVTRTR
ncbi:MAG: Spo0E like sporulation regulatory protein [Paenibacillus sp.]|jgi:hypothetical protein|nr:Spo0E like sporulation regulatory protein [Paenibacillus sp.]